MGKSKSVTVGYKYYLGLHTVLCQNPIDYVRKIRIQKENAWAGIAMDSQLSIDQPELFGGKDGGGGWQGAIDVLGGDADQIVNDYLDAQFVGPTPAYRGVVSMAFRKNYIGNSPFLPPIATKVTSIYRGYNEWLPEYAAVPAMGGEEAALESKKIYVAIDNSYSMWQEPWQRIVTAKATVTGLLESLKGMEPNIRLVTFGNSTSALSAIEYSDATDAELDAMIAWVAAISSPGGITDAGSNYVGAVASAPTFFGGGSLSDLSLEDIFAALLGGLQSIFLGAAPNYDAGIEGGHVMVILTDGEANPTSSAADARAIIDTIPNLRSYVIQIGTEDQTYSSLLANTGGFVAMAGETEVNMAVDFPVSVASNTVEVGNNGRPTPVLDTFVLDPDAWETANYDGISTGDLLGDVVINHNDASGNIYIWLDVQNIPDGSTITYSDAVVIDKNLDGKTIDDAISVQSLTQAQYDTNGDGTLLYNVGDWGILSQDAPGVERKFTITKPSGAYAIRFTVAMDAMFEALGQYAGASLRRPILKIAGTEYSDAVARIIAAVWGEHDRNPAHMLRDLVIAPWYGGSGDESEIGTTFATAAATLYDERLGLSLFHANPSQKDDFKRLIEEHIDGAMYFDHTTGKWEVKLIRDDYDVADLFTFDGATITDWVTVERPIQRELPNQITVKWTQRESGDSGSITRHNLAAIQQVGAIIPETRDYPGVTVERLAAALCMRDLAARTVPLITGSFRATYVPQGVFPGAAIIVDDDRVGISSTVCRVTEVNYGDGVNNEALISFVEDKFSLLDGGFTSSDQPAIVTGALPPNARIVEEAPYYTTARQLGEIDIGLILDADPDAGFLNATCDQPDGRHINAYIAKYNGTDWYRDGSADFSAYGTLLEAIGPSAAETTVKIAESDALYEVRPNDLMTIGTEYMRVDAISITSGVATITVGRGCLDTVPASHFVGDAALIWGGGSDEVEYTSGQTVQVKLLPRTSKSILPPSQAETDSVTFASRLIRPLPPGKFQLDAAYTLSGVQVGDLAGTWTHRDRLTQTTASPEDYTDGDVGPEASVSYTPMRRNVILRGDLFDLADLFDAADLFAENTRGTAQEFASTTGKTHTFSADGADLFDAADLFDLSDMFEGAFASDTAGIEFGVKSVRGGYDNWQTKWIFATPLLPPINLTATEV